MTMTPSKKNPSESLNKVMSHITPAEKCNGISGTLGSLRRKGKLARAYLRPRFAPGKRCWELGVPHSMAYNQGHRHLEGLAKPTKDTAPLSGHVFCLSEWS